MNNNIGTKIDNVAFELKTFKKETTEKVEILKEKIENLENANEKLTSRIERLEQNNKRENLIFYGIFENDPETFKDLLNIVENLLKSNLKIEVTNFDITNIFRIGKKSSKTRPVLVTFHSIIKRNEIIKNCFKLKNTGIYVSEDLIEKDLNERRILVQHLKQAKLEKKEAKLIGKKLIVNGKVYTYQDLENPEENLYFSPQTIRKAASEPPTPSLPVSEDSVETNFAEEPNLSQANPKEKEQKNNVNPQVTKKVNQNSAKDKGTSNNKNKQDPQPKYHTRNNSANLGGTTPKNKPKQKQ